MVFMLRIPSSCSHFCIYKLIKYHSSSSCLSSNVNDFWTWPWADARKYLMLQSSLNPVNPNNLFLASKKEEREKLIQRLVSLVIMYVKGWVQWQDNDLNLTNAFTLFLHPHLPWTTKDLKLEGLDFSNNEDLHFESECRLWRYHPCLHPDTKRMVHVKSVPNNDGAHKSVSTIIVQQIEDHIPYKTGYWMISESGVHYFEEGSMDHSEYSPG